MEITDYEIATDVQDPDGEDLTGVVDVDDADDIQVVGQAIWYTIGSDFVISNSLTDAQREAREEPNKVVLDGDTAQYQYEINVTEPERETGRDWLIRRMDELGLPAFMVPSEVSPSGAFTRTRDFLVNSRNDEHWIETATGERQVEFETKAAGRSSFHLLANAYFKADELGQKDGEWKQVRVGVFHYDSDHQTIGYEGKIDRDDRMWPLWEQYRDRAVEMFDRMQESQVGRDIQTMIRRFTGAWTHTVKFRSGGAVYFVPEQYRESLDALKTLFEEIDSHHKTHGKSMELERLLVTNDSERREMVERRAQDHIENQVETALDDAMEQVRQNEEELSEEIIEAAEEQIRGNDAFAQEYNALLDLRLSVEDVLADFGEEIQGGVKGQLIDSLTREAATDGGQPVDE